MASWGYFFAGILFTTLAAFGVMITFITFVPMFTQIMNALSNVATTYNLTTPYNPFTYITQGNTILQGSFDFIMIALAAICFFIAFGNEPNESIAISNSEFGVTADDYS